MKATRSNFSLTAQLQMENLLQMECTALNAFVEILLILLLIVTFTANSAKTNVFY